MKTATLYDLTSTNVSWEMLILRYPDHPLADRTFRRHVDEVKTDDQRERQTERLLKARRVA